MQEVTKKPLEDIPLVESNFVEEVEKPNIQKEAQAVKLPEEVPVKNEDIKPSE